MLEAEECGAGAGDGGDEQGLHGINRCLGRQGLRTGSLFFPGGNATYQGEQVSVKKVESLGHKYDNETEWRQNIDTVMKWFTEENLDFVTLYFGEPDSTGHKHGPESQQRKDMVSQVDRTVGYLRQRIRESGLEPRLNLIITSDHGMETVIKQDEIYLRNVSNFSFQDIQFELLDYGPNGLLVPKEGKLEQVYQVLKDAHPRLHVFKKEEFPRRLRYADNSRITPLLMYSDPGYVIHGVRPTGRCFCSLPCTCLPSPRAPAFVSRPRLPIAPRPGAPCTEPSHRLRGQGLPSL